MKKLKKVQPASLKQVLAKTAAAAPTLASSSPTLKLDLAAGQNVREGFEGVDIWPGSKHIVDLMRFPWPWADNSIDDLHCSHFVEHIPMQFVDEAGNYVPMGTSGSQDLLLRFFDECYRILRPDGWMQVHVPCHRNDRAFQDPTHRRFITQQTFLYLNRDWRNMNKLDHYNVKCHYGVDVGHFMDASFGVLHEEVQAKRFPTEWNLIIDWVAKLQAKK